MTNLKLKECYQHGAKCFGWQQGYPAVASLQKSKWKVGIGRGGGISREVEEEVAIGAALFSDGHLLIHGPEAMLYPGCETLITKMAVSKFDLDPAHIFIARHQKEIPALAAMELFNNTQKKVGLIEEIMLLLQQKIKHIAIKEAPSLSTNSLPDELIISKGFVGENAGVGKIAVVDMLWQNGLQLVEVTTSAGNSQQENLRIPCTCVVHHVEIMLHGITEKWKVNKLVTVIDGGHIQDLQVMASHLKNALLVELSKNLPAYSLGRQVDFARNGETDKPGNAFFGDLPSIEIIFIHPWDKQDETPFAGIDELTSLYLDSFSHALQNAIEQAT